MLRLMRVIHEWCYIANFSGFWMSFTVGRGSFYFSSNRFFNMNSDDIAGISATTRSTGIIPFACAINPSADITIAITPHEKPLINPPITLLYCGIMLCAITIVTGIAIAVNKPIIAKITKDNIGHVL